MYANFYPPGKNKKQKTAVQLFFSQEGADFSIQSIYKSRNDFKTC